MSRTTIDFGIELGTRNSRVAVWSGTEAQVLRNNDGMESTPSAVWVDNNGRIHVGRSAAEQVAVSSRDAYTDFRLQMGSNTEYVFARSGLKMRPEDLSAEVLKSLKADAQVWTGEEIEAAVITVPAAFDLPECDATRKAAQLAGFTASVLLLEPVAAALAYGFQNESENALCLVYDFGGGTFDAAVMRVRDGLIQVVNHDGDNHLGGKLIDWDIVEKRLAPALTAQYNLPDFGRNNKRWARAFGSLKYYAEQAKIEVCRTKAPNEIYIEGLCKDANGAVVDFVYRLTPTDVEEVSKPYIERSLRLCRKTLQDKGLAGSDMERVLMVGGSTLNPWVREAVQAGLGATLDFGIDPVTVVARGAAIFASTQPLSVDDSVQLPEGVWRIEVEHEPVGNVSDPDIGGRVAPPDGRSLQGFTIEFIDKKTRWRSGRISLGTEGVFMTQLFAEEKRRCEYDIDLCDPTGTKIPTSPARVIYTIGVIPDKPPASNTIGVGLANDVVLVFIEKGTKLPARKLSDLRSTVALRAGKAEDVLGIAVIEGENPRATRNHGIGKWSIYGTDIRRDLPAGSKVEVTVTMDESQDVRVHAYFPAIDEDLPEWRFDPKTMHNSLGELRKELEEQKKRLGGAREQAGKTKTLKADSAIMRIDGEQLVEQVDSLVAAAGHDNDALSQLDRRIRESGKRHRRGRGFGRVADPSRKGGGVPERYGRPRQSVRRCLGQKSLPGPGGRIGEGRYRRQPGPPQTVHR